MVLAITRPGGTLTKGIYSKDKVKQEKEDEGYSGEFGGIEE